MTTALLLTGAVVGYILRGPVDWGRWRFIASWQRAKTVIAEARADHLASLLADLERRVEASEALP